MVDASRQDAGGLIARTVAGLRYAFTGQQPTEWFGPGRVLPDQAPPEVRGRAFDYPAFVNINYRPRNTERVGFDKLKQLAATCEPLKLVMARQRDLVRSLEWTIKPRKRAGGTLPRADDAAIGKIIDLFERPDGEHDWAQWIGAVLDQMFVLDAVSIYGRPTLAGDLYALELIDGATITPLVDASGRRPAAPDAAYKQVLKGLPATHYTADELIYFPETYRVDHIYGWSRVEQIIETAEMTIERMKSQKGYFTQGNTGDGFFTGPPDWTPEQLRSFEASWNSVMHGDGGRRTADRRQTPWAPNGTGWTETKVGLSEPAFDEWLIRLVCFTFGVTPTPFLKQQGLGHGSATTEQAAAEEGGSAPVMDYVRRLMNRVLADWLKRPDLEFVHSDDREFDPAIAAEIDDKRLRNGSRTIDEVRDRNGEPPLADGLGAQPLIYTAGGATTIAAVLAPPPEPAVPPVDEPAPAEPTPPDMTKAAAPIAAAEAKLNKAIAAFLSDAADALAPQLAAAFGLAKGPPAMDDYAGRIDDAYAEVEFDWRPLAAKVEPLLARVAVTAGQDAAEELELFDKATLAKLTATTTDYAESRAAEMVGMRVVDGELVENPDAAWSIPATTRNMLRSTITEALERGDSTADLAKAITESAAFGAERATTIARTETATAEVQGTIEGWRATGLVAGKQFVASENCCDECQALDGQVVGLDEEFEGGDPPIHPNCLPGDALVLAKGVTATTERPFEGDLVVISTASGKHLSCTPNHPILTPGGWVAARLLDVGDDVVSSRIGDWMAGSTVGDDAEDVPTRIEEVAKAFRRSRKVTAVEVPVTAPDFHGDGEGSEVAVVWTDRLLVDGAQTPRRQHTAKPPLSVADVQAADHSGARAFHDALSRDLATASGDVGGSDLICARARVHGRPFEPLGFASSSPRDTVVPKHTSDHVARHAESTGNRLLGCTTNVSGNDLTLVDDGARSHLNAQLLKLAAEGVLADSRLAADLSDVLAVGVFADSIVDVRLRRFSGHVFNLDTTSGVYVAQGIVTHNCECTVTTVLPDEMPEAAPADPE